jgi:hypothetical protein
MVLPIERPLTASQNGACSRMERLNSRAFASGCTVDLAGLAVRVELGNDRRGDAFEELLGTLEPSDAEPEVEVTWIDTAASVPDRPSEYPHAGLDSWQEGSLAIYRHAGVTAVTEDNSIQLGGDEESLLLPFRYVFEPALTHVLARTGRFMLHSGSVARDGQALLLIGDSGQGKSTLCWAAAQHGWSLLSDDHTIVRPAATGGYELIGLPKPLAVPEEVLEEEIGVLVERFGRRRRQLPATMLGRGWYPLAATIRPRHGDTPEGALEPCSAGELLDLLIGSYAALGDADLLRRFFPHAASLTRGQTWDLYHGSDPSTRLSVAAGWLDVALQRGQAGH